MTQQICYTITGGDPIVGKIHCMGAKNFATKAMVASLLTNEVSYINNVPHIGDVEITQHILESTGAQVKWLNENTVQINPGTAEKSIIVLPDSRNNRVPILLLSILLHKFGKATVPVVGGDDIGKRNVDFHIQAIEQFGAEVRKEGNQYIAIARKKLKGCHINLKYPSVGATETCLFLSVLAQGTSIIKNIAIEPEIIELITMLRSMGAIIFINPAREVIIHGVDNLVGTNIYVIGDRIEVGSWASLACASDGEIEVCGVRPDLLGNFLSYYTQIGGGYKLIDANTILFFRKKKLKPIILETDVYPGFSTDWQQPFATLLTQANGMSVIHETVYEQRFGYLEILNKLGAKAQLSTECLSSLSCRYKGFDYEHSALIYGPAPLYAIDEPIVVPDIRAGLAYLIAAALAKGTTTMLSAEQIERGYGNLVSKLINTNLKIHRTIETKITI